MTIVIFAIISGMSMSLQGVFNTRLSEKIGLVETNVLVQGSALLITLLVSLALKKDGYKNIPNANKLYLLGGVLGVIITFTVIKSIGNMGATCGISIILVSQLISAALIDTFGLFGSTKTPLNFREFLSISLMICGIILLKWK